MDYEHLLGLVLLGSVSALAAVGSFWIFRQGRISADWQTLGALLGILSPVILLIVLALTYEISGWPEINE
jgi:hypothetical protein